MQSQNNSYDKLGGFKAELPSRKTEFNSQTKSYFFSLVVTRLAIQKQGGRERALSCLQMASAETGRMRLLGEKNTIFS